MKSLKISFAAIIAIIAVGLTVAAQAGAFESKTKAVADCYKPTGTQTITLRTVNCATVKSINDVSLCATPLVNEHIFALQGALVDPTQPGVCPGGSEFCCIRVAVDNSPCDGQQPINNQFLKVAQIFCEQ